ncbi:DUF4330 family protein [Candidatus Altiarchaeota archaeon]
MIDDKARLFGKVNAIDLFIILFLLACSVFIVMLVMPHLVYGSRFVELEVMLCDPLRDQMCYFVGEHVADEIEDLDSVGGFRIKDRNITRVRVYNHIGGEGIVLSDYREAYQVILTLEYEAPHYDGVYYLYRTPLKIDKRVSIPSKTIDLDVVILSINDNNK